MISDALEREINQFKEENLKAFLSLEPSRFCLFSNQVGGDEDPEYLESLLKKFELSEKSWFSIGHDCPGGICHDAFGQQIHLPTEIISEWMQDQNKTPHSDIDFRPLSFEELLRLMHK